MPDARSLPPATMRSSRRRALLRPLLGVLVAAALVLGAAPRPASALATWAQNLWVSSAFVYQDPYWNACTAAATMTMLNTIAHRGSGGRGFAWTPYRVKKSDDPAELRDMTSILSFARRHDTLDASGRGSDPHGWRNALNYYGWGEAAMVDPSLMPYVDRAYITFDAALRAAVKGVARRRMPVGLLAWAGAHAQVLTGYVVSGEDPRVSNRFTVVAVYLSDPLRSDELVNRRVSYDTLRSGTRIVRFRAYREADSPFDDPYVAGTIAGSIPPAAGPSEWYARWVVILPRRNGLPASS